MIERQKLWYLVVLTIGVDEERPCPLREMATHVKKEGEAIGGYQPAFFSRDSSVIAFFIRTASAPDAILSRIDEPKSFGRGSIFSPKDRTLCIEIGASLAERGFNMLRHWNDKRAQD
jgi:hypothetical protein